MPILKKFVRMVFFSGDRIFLVLYLDISAASRSPCTNVIFDFDEVFSVCIAFNSECFIIFFKNTVSNNIPKTLQTLKMSSKSKITFVQSDRDAAEISRYKTKNIRSPEKQTISTNSFQREHSSLRSTRCTKSQVKSAPTPAQIDQFDGMRHRINAPGWKCSLVNTGNFCK